MFACKHEVHNELLEGQAAWQWGFLTAPGGWALWTIYELFFPNVLRHLHSTSGPLFVLSGIYFWPVRLYFHHGFVLLGRGHSCVYKIGAQILPLVGSVEPPLGHTSVWESPPCQDLGPGLRVVAWIKCCKNTKKLVGALKVCLCIHHLLSLFFKATFLHSTLSFIGGFGNFRDFPFGSIPFCISSSPMNQGCFL